MTRTITLRDANQSFARCVCAVEEGEEFVITRNGRPVARLVPMAVEAALSPRRAAALERLRARMAEGWRLGAGPLDRASLHER